MSDNNHSFSFCFLFCFVFCFCFLFLVSSRVICNAVRNVLAELMSALTDLKQMILFVGFSASELHPLVCHFPWILFVETSLLLSNEKTSFVWNYVIWVIIGVHMLRPYGAGVLAGTSSSACFHSTTPVLLIAGAPMSSMCCWKTHQNPAWFHSFF